MCFQEFLAILAPKRRRTSEHLKENATQCVDVGAVVDDLSLTLLWRHVGNRSKTQTLEVGIALVDVSCLGKPEVRDFDLFVGSNEDVCWLEISMYNAVCVSRRHPLSDGPRKP